MRRKGAGPLGWRWYVTCCSGSEPCSAHNKKRGIGRLSSRPPASLPAHARPRGGPRMDALIRVSAVAWNPGMPWRGGETAIVF